ncbi:hypothetical protein LSUE1_G000848, partial [Lachnellula suecica]
AAKKFGHVFADSLSDISNTTLGFEKIFVINMPSRTDRRDATSLAAAASNLNIDFIEGVGGDSIPEAAFPPGGSADSIKQSPGIKGSWRSHMNALHTVVHQNLTTALIFEDDGDWDIRLRQQLHLFARASRLLTAGFDISQYPVETVTNPETPEKSIYNESSQNPISPTIISLPLSLLPATHSPHPYGDPASWDVLWLGHCGVAFPRPPETDKLSSKSIVLTHANDSTVPLPEYLRAHPFGPLDALAQSHPAHTRVYHRASGGALCTVAYAVSQRGARRLLHEFGVKKWSRIFDVEMGEWCAGSEASDERTCITSQPPIFSHHHPLGGESDIGGLGGGYARSVETKYVRKSVRMNLEALLRGAREEDLVDSGPGEGFCGEV